MNSSKTAAYIAFSILGVFCIAHSAAHAAWPDRPITVVLPTVAGSSFDINIRKLSEIVGKSLGQPLVIDNKPGAGGAIAMTSVARANPDGYTIGIGNTPSLAITPELGAKVAYDTGKSFSYISRFTSQANVLVVHKSLPVKTVEELTAYAKKNPGKLSMGSQGIGSTGHLSGEIYKAMTGADFVHVPYRGGPQAIQDLVGGRVDFIFENTSTIESYLAEGSVRPLAVTSSDRLGRFPKIPTMKEAGIKDFEATVWTVVLAPAGIPTPVSDRLNRAINAALSSPEFRKFLVERGTVPHGGSSADARTFVLKEQEKWRDVIKRTGATNR
ncbi:Bug family tripartite tricarboxylate transporter substrate binding protein [Cupriavidus sp. a3]|uniref:Bug family tripartite tricarboxylate transporter substrate binding protein n=1 Tax=Cupriavidus sp. a3 TaxID=3242158 RepID=UPI003D9C3DCA